jgi:hypothetical protein
MGSPLIGNLLMGNLILGIITFLIIENLEEFAFILMD